MEKFNEILSKKERLIIGVMSGTSLDGVDIALVRLLGAGMETSIRLVEFRSYTYPRPWRARLRKVFEGTTEDVCRVNMDLGRYFAELLLGFCREVGLEAGEIDAIGCHGQTVYHIHNHSTLQIGEADVIARQLETIVISDFRTADIAAGGSGAPLVPYFDRVCFGRSGKNIALQNIGGISNVTFIPANESHPVTAFDTGPGNAVLNEMISHISKGLYSYDRDAFLSRQGTVQPDILDGLLQHPYFGEEIPKSTGREVFGRQYVDSLVKTWSSAPPADLLRTLVSLVAGSIHRSCMEFLPEIDEMLVSGGGAHHPLIMEELQQRFGKKRVRVFREINGITADSKEAVAFALLANERLNGIPANVPSVTGAKKAVCLGKISIP